MNATERARANDVISFRRCEVVEILDAVQEAISTILSFVPDKQWSATDALKLLNGAQMALKCELQEPAGNEVANG